MNPSPKGRTRGLVLAIMISGAFVPIVLVHSTSEPPVGLHMPLYTIYRQLASRVDTSSFNEYPLITADFTAPGSTQTTIFATVSVFVQPSQCCPGAFAMKLGIDNDPTQQIGGGDTSRFIGLRVTLTSFQRVSFASGPHSVTLVVFNGGGTWTIDAGALTALLIEFN